MLLECEEAPAVPDSEGLQSDVARYILKLYEAHQDCRGNLKSVNKLLNEFEEANKTPE
jgi:hypothetical protein